MTDTGDHYDVIIVGAGPVGRVKGYRAVGNERFIERHLDSNQPGDTGFGVA